MVAIQCLCSVSRHSNQLQIPGASADQQVSSIRYTACRNLSIYGLYVCGYPVNRHPVAERR